MSEITPEGAPLEPVQIDEAEPEEDYQPEDIPELPVEEPVEENPDD